MKHIDALGDGDLYSANIKSAKEWIERNKSRIKAEPNKTIFYSGRDYDLEELRDNIPSSDRKAFMGTPIYKRLAAMGKRSVTEKIPLDFQTLEAVMTKIRSHPVIIDKDRIEQEFAHAWDCYQQLDELPKLIPAKTMKECWKRLSEVFASNAVGDIKILDGCADDYTQLKEDKDYIQKELPRLLSGSENLSDEGKEVLMKQVQKYAAFFDRRYTGLMRQLDQSRKRLNGDKAS